MLESDAEIDFLGGKEPLRPPFTVILTLNLLLCTPREAKFIYVYLEL